MKLDRKNIERGIYILIIVLLVIYGLWDSEAAARLISAVKDAFSILLQ